MWPGALLPAAPEQAIVADARLARLVPEFCRLSVTAEDAACALRSYVFTAVFLRGQTQTRGDFSLSPWECSESLAQPAGARLRYHVSTGKQAVEWTDRNVRQEQSGRH